jgi:hypothetical protein
MVRKLAAVAGALLVGFHGWLLASQFASGELTDASSLSRWAIAAGLGGVLWYLNRQGISVVWGRKAVAVWLLVAALHAPAATDRLSGADLTAANELAAVLVQVSAGAIVLATLIGSLFALTGVRVISGPGFLVAAPPPPRKRPSAQRTLLSPRPPPSL